MGKALVYCRNLHPIQPTVLCVRLGDFNTSRPVIEGDTQFEYGNTGTDAEVGRLGYLLQLTLMFQSSVPSQMVEISKRIET